MACNTCTKSFTFLRKEKACPACGFSYCSTCLNNKVFVKKLNSEAKVCAKCKNTVNSEQTLRIQPPDAYYKRIGIMNPEHHNTGKQFTNDRQTHPTDDEIQQRLQKLKTNPTTNSQTTDKEIAERLKQLKGENPTISNAEIEEKLLKLRKARLERIKNPDDYKKLKIKEETKGEEELVQNILEKYKAEASLEIHESVTETDSDELPFCEICNEDATMRCLGCKYLFCRRCYLEHLDDDDGCNKFEPYKPPKGVKYQ